MVVPQSSVGAIAISKTVVGRLVLMRIMPDKQLPENVLLPGETL
jgi:hypothetical protein